MGSPNLGQPRGRRQPGARGRDGPRDPHVRREPHEGEGDKSLGRTMGWEVSVGLGRGRGTEVTLDPLEWMATLRARLLRPQLEWTPESPEVLPWIPTSCVELAKKMGMRGNNIEKGQTEGVA